MAAARAAAAASAVVEAEAAAVAGVVEVAVDVAVVADSDEALFIGTISFNRNDKGNSSMTPSSYGGLKMLLFSDRKPTLRTLFRRLSILLLVSLAVVALGSTAFAAGKKSKIGPRQTFTSPEEAVQALVVAAKANDPERLLTILGPDGKELVYSGDEVADKAGLERFSRAYDEKHEIVMRSEKKAILEVGKDAWPLPIPVEKATDGKWSFDTRQGKEEILNRRIGKNELSTIQVCLAYVDAQREYASKDRSGDGILEYAQKFASDPGKKNGLYWEAKNGEEKSPLGPFVANAIKQGYSKKSDNRPAPYHGYFYKILKAQGKNAPRGAYQYVSRGRMIGGFALVAYPAQYGTSGIMTFIVSQDGVVYQKDLGRNTASGASAMTKFDPDRTWVKVQGKYLEPPESEGGD